MGLRLNFGCFAFFFFLARFRFCHHFVFLANFAFAILSQIPFLQLFFLVFYYPSPFSGPSGLVFPHFTLFFLLCFRHFRRLFPPFSLFSIPIPHFFSFLRISAPAPGNRKWKPAYTFDLKRVWGNAGMGEVVIKPLVFFPFYRPE